jgi:serine phosphatase RsbU (regulator of sigma subunit)
MDVRNQLFGAEAIEETLSRAGHAPRSEKIIKGLLEDVRAFVGEAHQSDDITMLVIKYLGRDHSNTPAMR